jgi:hypothetical protein
MVLVKYCKYKYIYDEAKVVLNGAQITRIGNLTLSKGDLIK